MFLSVIVPIYNTELYLERCIHSILSQPCQTMELILIDDGSTDNSAEICHKMAALDSRIRYFRKENGGLSSARNAGIEHARGDYLFFVDSDDYLEPDVLEKLLKLLSGTDLLIFNFNTIHSTGAVSTSSIPSREYTLRTDRERFDYLFHELFQNLSRGGHGWMAWNRVFRMDIIQNHQLRFYDNSKIFAEDLDFNIRYLYFCKHIQTTTDIVYHYELHDASIMGCSSVENKLPHFNRLSLHLYHFVMEEHSRYWQTHYYLIHYAIFRHYYQKLFNRVHSPGQLADFSAEIENQVFFRHQLRKLLTAPPWIIGRYLNRNAWPAALAMYVNRFYCYFFVKRILYKKCRHR